MKQEYRHTKPYRGKDPTFEKEEIKIWNGLSESDRHGVVSDISRRKKMKIEKEKHDTRTENN
jgi:predicted Fe-S protein YdhL (DUF1289 family)